MAELNLPQVFRRAVEVLDERGWWRGWYVGPGGCVCASAALAVAAGVNLDQDGVPDGEDDADRLWHDASEYVAVVAGRDLVIWNDRDGRTVDEVQALFLQAAEEADRG